MSRDVSRILFSIEIDIIKEYYWVEGTLFVESMVYLMSLSSVTYLILCIFSVYKTFRQILS